MGTTSPKFRGMVRRSDAKRASTPRFHGRSSVWDQVELTPEGTATHPFDFIQVRHRLGPENLNAQLFPILLTFPYIRGSTRSERDVVV